MTAIFVYFTVYLFSVFQLELQGRREQELENNPRWKKYWKAFLKKDSKVPAEDKEKLDFERRFLKRLIEKFLGILEKIPQKGKLSILT